MPSLAPINEIFASIQGEGPNIGHPSVFIRLSGCNLNCQWCDTKYANDSSRMMSAMEVVKEFKKLAPNYLWSRYDIVITGGEPMLHPNFINELLPIVGGQRVTIETNGTIPIELLNFTATTQFVDHIIVSPKLEFIPNDLGYRRSLEGYGKCTFGVGRDMVYFKYVHTGENIGNIVSNISEMGVSRDRVYLMSLGTKAEELRELDESTISFVKEYGFKWTPRAHIYVYGNKRGV